MESGKERRMNRKTRIYLSGPMRGVDEEVAAANFKWAYDYFRSLNYDCYMPGQQATADLNDNYTFFLTDMAIIISWADVIVLVSKDWEKSLGCQAEVRTAFAIGLSVWLCTDEDRAKRVWSNSDGTILTSIGSIMMTERYLTMRRRQQGDDHEVL